MIKRLLGRFALWLMRRYYVGREVYRLSTIHGTPLVRGKGKIIGCMKTDDAFVVKYLEQGSAVFDVREINVFDLKMDRNLKAPVFYD